MKKALVLSLILGVGVIAAPVAEAKSAGTAASAAASSAAQPGWRNRNRRSYITTRIVRIGFRTYRETYRVTYRPNGTVVRRLISRVRIR